MEGFGADLKTFLCLAMPNQYCQIEAGFRVIFLAGKVQFCMIPTIVYSTTILHDTTILYDKVEN